MKKFGRWRGALDKESGRIYYYHTFSNKVTWVKPKEMVEQENRRKAQKMKKYLKKKNKNKNEVNEKVIEAFQSTGLRFFMDSAAISVIDFCLDRKDFNGAKDAVIQAVYKSPNIKLNPMTISLASQLRKNNNFDMMLSIKAVGEACIEKEKRFRFSSSLSNTQKAITKEKSFKSAGTLPSHSNLNTPPKFTIRNDYGDPPPLPQQTSALQNPKPPSFTSNPPTPPKPSPPPKPFLQNQTVPPKPPSRARMPPPPKRIQSSQNRHSLQPPSFSKEPTPSNDSLLPPPFMNAPKPPHNDSLVPPPIENLVKPPSTRNLTSATNPPPPNSNHSEKGGRADLLMQIQMGKQLKKTEVKDRSIPGPPPEDASMANALRLKLEDQRKYLAELNESSSEDSIWE